VNKFDIFNIRRGEVVIFSFVGYLYSCKGENVQFVMHIHEVLWFTTIWFLMSEGTIKKFLHHLARKILYFKPSIIWKALICVTMNYVTKVTKISAYLVPITFVCFVTIIIKPNSRTLIFCYNSTCWIVVGIGVSLMLFWVLIVLYSVNYRKIDGQYSCIHFQVSGSQFESCCCSTLFPLRIL